MKKLLFILSIQLAVLSCQYSYGQWVQTSCPTGNDVYCIDTSGTNIFAGISGAGGVYLSTNNGASWNKVNNGLPYDSINHAYYEVYSLAISGENIFAGTEVGIYLSTNNGGNWTTVNNGYMTTYCVNTIAISGGNVFAGTCGEGVFLSTNNGTSWAAMNNGITNGNDFAVYSLAISGINIFAGTWGGVYLSTDNGGSWNPVNIGFTGIPDTVINCLAISGKNIFAGIGAQGIFLSTNNGANWNTVNNELTDTTQVMSFAITGTNIFAGIGGGVFLSTDNGASWHPVNNGLPDNTFTGYPFIYSLAISGGYIFAGTNQLGIWKRSLSDILGVNELGIRNEELGIKIFPNPVNEQTAISYRLSAKSMVDLRVYDMMGNEVATLVNQEQEKGDYNLQFSILNLQLNSGVYFVRMVAGESSVTRKIIIVH